MPAPITLPPQLAGGRLFTVADARAAGLDADDLRGRAVRRVVRGVYVDARSELTESMLLDAVEMRCPGAVWLGDVAVAAWRLPLPLDRRPVRIGQPTVCSAGSRPPPHILLPQAAHQRTPRDGYRVTVGKCGASDVATVAGRRLLRPAPLMTWLARDWPLEDLVALGDAALARGCMTTEELSRAISARLGQPGIGRCREAQQLLDERAKSPMESRLRVALRLAGLPAPEVNLMVTSAPPGHRGPEVDTLGELDLCWPLVKVGVEYDGEDHARPRARSNDYSKRRLFARYGWEVVPVTAWDYFNRLDAVIEEVRGHLRGRGVAC
jgi:hypothetical protein